MAGQAAPVLIVGAGPTGLTLANALVRQGVRVVIAERNAVPCRDSKALAINVASQYGFQTIGMEDAAGRGGNLLVRAGVYWQNKRLTGIDLRRLDDGCARVIVQPQADTERELIAALAACGQAVHWNTTVTALVPHADGTTTTLAGPDGDTVHEFAYVVGCDGKHSLVRRQMGASFDGPDYPFHFVLGDFTLRWDAPVDQARYYADENGFFIMVPLGAKSWRVVVKRDGPMPQGRPDPAMITAPVRAHLGEVFLDDAPTWLSSAPCYSRTSDRLRAGRLLLAGDAAHLFTPLGGTGMNTGIQDALSLAWRLALRLRGTADDSLLDAYEAERLETIAANARGTDHITRLIAGIERSSQALAAFLPTMANRPALRSTLPRRLAGLDFRYAAGVQPVPGSPEAGSIWPLPALLRQTHARHGPRLFAVVAAHGDETALAALQRLHDAFPTVLCAVVLVPNAAAPALRARLPRLTVFARGECPEAGTLPAGCLLLVDPDATVRFSGALDEHETLHRLLIRRMGAGSGTSSPRTTPQAV